jgi:transcriptional regulator with XRE-family HTH domain
MLIGAHEGCEASMREIPPTLVFVKKKVPMELNFHEHLAALRKQRGLTQMALAELVGLHISQIRRYESGQSQPTLDAIRKLSVALSVSADMLLFEKDERGPDQDLKLQFEAVSRLDPEEKKVIRSVIESIILRNTMKEAERRFSLAHLAGDATESAR